MKEQEKTPAGGLSRRGFLKGAGLSVAAGTLLGSAREGLREAAPRPARRLAQGHTQRVKLRLNGHWTEVLVQTADTLLEVLRTQLDLTGCKPVCDMGSCGACCAIVNGRAVNSCLVLAVDLEGASVETVEGLQHGNQLHPVQEAFIHADATQCGFCTPGMVMTCKALVDRNPTPTREDVQEAISGNLCRCGTYANIFRAMERVSAANGRGK